MTSCRSGVLIFCILFTPVMAIAQEFKSGVEWQAPPVVTPGETDAQPPSDAIVLFGGTDMSAWEGGEWKVEDGVVTSSNGNVTTKQKFGDIQLHIEWSAPAEIKGQGQGRGNSGVFLMEQYEVQILDSFENTTYFDGQAGSVYKQTPPMVNAMRKPGEWNTYDLFWTAPAFRVNGDVATPAYVTLMHNGVLVMNHFELLGPSSYTEAAHYTVHDPTGSIKLQDHGNPIRFRNIWVRELHPPVGRRVSAPYVMKNGKKISVEEAAAANEADRLVREIKKAMHETEKRKTEQDEDGKEQEEQQKSKSTEN